MSNTDLIHESSDQEEAEEPPLLHGDEEEAEPLLTEESLLQVGGSIPHPAPVDILCDGMDGAIVHYGSIPIGTDWTDGKSVHMKFQPIFEKTRTMVPMCLLMDAKTVLDKLKIVNFWRSLDKDGVALWKGKLAKIYKRPTVSNDRKSSDQFARVQQALRSDPLAIEAIGGEDVELDYVYAGLADKTAIRAAATRATASSNRSKKKKKKRRTSTEPPTNSNQIFDRIGQNGMINAEKAIEAANDRTIGMNTEFPGFARVFSMQLRGVSTPPKNGRLPIDERERKKVKIDLFGDGYQDEYFAKSPNVVAKYNDFLKALHDSQKYDFEIHPLGSMPPTQAFRKSRQEPTYRTVAELDADLDRAEEEGRVTQVEYEMGTI